MTYCLRHKTLAIFAFLALQLAVHAQFGNEWIDPGKAYFKFSISSEGWYRIPFATLDAAGLSSVPVQQFRLWRQGKEVPIYASRASGNFSASDFIEFYGQPNDGRQDTRLYRDPTLQPSDTWSLFTDTAVYFLVADPSVPGLRYAEIPNQAAASQAEAAPYCLHTLDLTYRTRLHPGFAMNVGVNVYASTFDAGEGWSSREITPANALRESLRPLQMAGNGPDPVVSISASGMANNARTLRLRVNGAEVFTAPLDNMSLRSWNTVVPMSRFIASEPVIEIQNGSSVTSDRMLVHRLKITYPRNFQLSGEERFLFSLPASLSDKKVAIAGFSPTAKNYILLDQKAGRLYPADTSVAGLLQFHLLAAEASDYILLARTGSSVRQVSELRKRNFTDYSQPSQQGDFLIISHPRLFQSSAGNPVEAYRAYRASSAGGSYLAKVVDIEELTDQFGYGIRQHPAAIRHFLRYARQYFKPSPKRVFLVGRGVTYDQYRLFESRPLTASIGLIPTFGNPGSDNMLASDTLGPVADIDIGRLSVVSGEEVKDYLDKVREQEDVLRTGGQTLRDRGWTKNVVHAVGGSDTYLQSLLFGYMNAARTVIADTLFGGNVKTFSNNPIFATQQLSTAQLQSLFAEGIGMLTYFGHSSATALEFNISDPYAYENAGRYPFFFVNGCNAGNFFLYDSLRYTSTNQTLSEKYILAKKRGSIAFVASTHFGIVNYLKIYIDALYRILSATGYGQSIGSIQRAALGQMLKQTGSMDFYGRMHAEQITLHGDPALQVYPHSKPDYVIEEQHLRIQPSFVTVADASFEVEARILNIGRAVRDSVSVRVSRQLPDGSRELLWQKKIPGIAYSDSIRILVPVRPLTDKGENKISVEVDPDGSISELSEANNSITRSLTIIEDQFKPVYPAPYAIIDTNRLVFIGSTADPLAPLRLYQADIDTTAAFDSPFRKTVNVSASGGLIQFAVPGLTLTDKTVYYWRVAPASGQGSSTTAPVSSFTYVKGQGSGFGQAHYYQYRQAAFSSMRLDADRQFRFEKKPASIVVRSGIFPLYPKSRINLQVDDKYYVLWGCRPASLQFVVYDSTSLLPVRNRLQADGKGMFGSVAPCQYNDYLFEFPYDQAEGRKAAMDFLDSLPVRSYFSLTNLGSLSNAVFIDEWQRDTLRYGAGHSLYHRLKQLGFADLDRFTSNLPFLFFTRKGDPSASVVSIMGESRDTYIDRRIDVQMGLDRGSITSPWLGPARRWGSLQWDVQSLEQVPDRVFVDVIGQDSTGTEEWLARVQGRDTSFMGIDARRFPFLKLRMTSIDSLQFTPAQLRYWRLLAEPLPEGALEPNMRFSAPDTVDQGQPYPFSVVFRNVSAKPFDSLSASMAITDVSNITRIIPVPKTKPLQPGDTVLFQVAPDTKHLTGDHTLKFEVNPSNQQPEQFRFNNTLYKRFHVRADVLNPVLDVTFDGSPILNRDIVSAKPKIDIRLRDESRYLPLNDTSLIRISIRYPDGKVRAFRYGTDTLRFVPADPPPVTENVATALLQPVFSQDGEYELIVDGRDRNGNLSGSAAYRVLFQVINKSMISDLFNYPNPFSTSTAFVFTVTGHTPPRDLRIQILTVTGTIVREITARELGPVRIGRNITEFRWDGTDAFGQPLANGVYLYRLVMDSPVQTFEKWKPEGMDTQGFFRAGYGKMQILR